MARDEGVLTAPSQERTSSDSQRRERRRPSWRSTVRPLQASGFGGELRHQQSRAQRVDEHACSRGSPTRGILANSVCPGLTATWDGAEQMGARPIEEGAAFGRLGRGTSRPPPLGWLLSRRAPASLVAIGAASHTSSHSRSSPASSTTSKAATSPTSSAGNDPSSRSGSLARTTRRVPRSSPTRRRYAMNPNAARSRLTRPIHSRHRSRSKSPSNCGVAACFEGPFTVGCDQPARPSADNPGQPEERRPSPARPQRGG